MGFSIFDFRLPIAERNRRVRPRAAANQKSQIKNQKSASGFTLTEILIAIFVLSIGLMGVISVFPVGVDATTKTLDRSASAIAVGSAIAELEYTLQPQAYSTGTATVTVYPGPSGTDYLDIGGDRCLWNAILAAPPPNWGPLATTARTDRRMTLAQIALFSDPPITYEGKAKFSVNSANVNYAPPNGMMPSGLTAGCYIRRIEPSPPAAPPIASRWFLVQEIDPAASNIVLTEPFRGATTAGLPPNDVDAFIFTQRLYQTFMTLR